jgi:tripeptide aminopeptidase
MENLVDRFIRYARINTQSDESSKTCPSTPAQLEFANMLCNELKSVGMDEVNVDENGYVMATLPANTSEEIPTIGFIAHMDISPDLKISEINPQVVVLRYGKPIVINTKNNLVLSPLDYPSLNSYMGQSLVVTDGHSNLGADDKAGITEIIGAMEYLIAHPEIKHGKIRIAFTPDEEIGRGADKFEVAKFGAAFAYTVDGEALGEIQFENFNAAKAKISIQGLNVHPGSAKNKMKNSMLIAMELNAMLPSFETPEHTEHYEGFYHLAEISGSVESTTMNYILRDHDKERFNHKKELLIKIVDHLNLKYGQRTVKIIMVDQYYNMKEKIEPVFSIVELALEAMKETGIAPKVVPVRGGTDGSRLSYMGLPCPNLFTGAHNLHSRFEYLPVKSMEKAVELIVKIIELHALKSNKKGLGTRD